MNYGLWTVDCGLRTAGYGLKKEDHEQSLKKLG